MKISFCCTDTAAEPWLQGLRAALPQAEITQWAPGAPAADFAVVWTPPQVFFDQQQALKAVFNIGAGVDALLKLRLPPHAMVVRLEDAGMSVQMAEYVSHAVIRYFREFDSIAADVRQGIWHQRKPCLRSEFTVGVLGLGVLGRRVAQTLAQFDFPVRGWSLNAKQLQGVACFAGPGQWHDFLHATRVLVCLLPLTKDTADILCRETLEKLPPGAYVINVARGAHLVDEDLLSLLDSGHLAGATLDVFRAEPLPQGHPFWNHPKIILTPHTSARTLREESIAQIAAKIAAVGGGLVPPGAVNLQLGQRRLSPELAHDLHVCSQLYEGAPMKQQTLAIAADQSFENYRKPTRRDEFLKTMEAIVPWAALCTVVEPHYPKAGNGRPPIGLERMLRIHFVQHWFNLADMACEEALYDSASLRRFVGIDLGREPVPDSTTITKFRKLLNDNKLGEALFAKVGKELQARGFKVNTGTIVDATIIGAPSSTKNADKARDPEMHQTRKGQQWYFGMKLHIGVDSQSGLVHSAVVTPANVHDKHPLPDLLHGNEQRVYGDSAYASQKELIVSKAPHARDFTNQRTRYKGFIDEAVRAKNRNKSRIRSRVEHVFGVVKRLWGFCMVRYRGLQKNATRAFTALALANIYLGRQSLLAQVRS